MAFRKAWVYTDGQILKVGFKADYSYNSLIMYLVLTGVLMYAILNEEHWYFYTFYPVAFYLYNSRTKYQITAEELVIEKIFNKKIIPTNRIRRVEIVEKKKWIQILNGKPNRYVVFKFNKFDEIETYPEHLEKFQELLLQQKEADVVR